MAGDQQKNQHLWWRAGFGPALDQLEDIRHSTTKKILHRLLDATGKPPVLFDVADPSVKSLMQESGDNPLSAPARLSPEARKKMRVQSVRDIRTLNIRWLQEMTDGEAQLREKMALFWHGHFACKTVNILYDQDLLNIIRTGALGNFRDLLLKVSKSAAMTRFLNNDQNRRNHPNENFARELMELFTLGRGNYTEPDVKASARAFTGWGNDLQGHFVFRERQHDAAEKTFLGKTGRLSGEDILDILLANRQTALFITRKIYRFFVRDPADEIRVASLAAAFYDSGYDIQKLMESIFSSAWFYDAENRGTRIKSPVEWMVGIRRQLPQEIGNPEMQILLQRLLGQVLFNPPNVAGWPGGKHWIDSSTLMLRLHFPQVLSSADTLRARPKGDDDLTMGLPDRLENTTRIDRPGSYIQAKIYWERLAEHFRDSGEAALLNDIRNWLLPVVPAIGGEALDSCLDRSDRNSLIRSAVIRFMGTPEYQLC